jgi:soluble lytic murein transglycosylase-like protein
MDRVIRDTAERYGLPAALLHSVIKAESNFRPDAVSPKGAIGLMQLMPGTARMLGADPADPVQNVDAGARYLLEMLKRFDNGAWSALAAYNAGPGAVDRYNGIPPYRETREYVSRVWNLYQRAERAGELARPDRQDR